MASKVASARRRNEASCFVFFRFWSMKVISKPKGLVLTQTSLLFGQCPKFGSIFMGFPQQSITKKSRQIANYCNYFKFWLDDVPINILFSLVYVLTLLKSLSLTIFVFSLNSNSIPEPRFWLHTFLQLGSKLKNKTGLIRMTS